MAYVTWTDYGVYVRYVPAYFSRTCYCHIPARWVAGAGQWYGEGQTREEAIASLRRNMGV